MACHLYFINTVANMHPFFFFSSFFLIFFFVSVFSTGSRQCKERTSAADSNLPGATVQHVKNPAHLSHHGAQRM